MEQVFIGSNLSLKLIDKGYNVAGLYSLSPQIHGGNAYLYGLLKIKLILLKVLFKL